MDAYRLGANEAGHVVKVIDVARLDFPLLRVAEGLGNGIGPIGESVIGTVASESPTKHAKWLGKMRELGRKGL